MSTLEHIRIEIIKAQDALAEARDTLLRLRRTDDADQVTAMLRRAATHVAQAVDGCQRLKEGAI